MSILFVVYSSCSEFPSHLAGDFSHWCDKVQPESNEEDPPEDPLEIVEKPVFSKLIVLTYTQNLTASACEICFPGY
jgi:hypothetical protein